MFCVFSYNGKQQDWGLSSPSPLTAPRQALPVGGQHLASPRQAVLASAGGLPHESGAASQLECMAAVFCQWRLCSTNSCGKAHGKFL